MRYYLNYILFTQTHKWQLQLIRSLCAGGVAAGIDIGTLYILTEYFNIHYLISAVFGFSLGTLIIYLLCINWIFPERKFKKAVEFSLFVLLNTIGLILNEIVLFILVEFFSLWYIIAKVISIGIVFVYNFVSRRVLIFSR